VPDIGNTLREARIRRGLTIADVENVTKIRTKYLQALEENDFEVLPGPTVVRGFLRSYALFLKVDPEGLLEEYAGSYEVRRDEIGQFRSELTTQRRSQTSAERKQKRTRRTQRGYVAAALLAIVIIAVIAWLGARNGDKGGAVLDGSSVSSSSTMTTSSSTTTLPVDDTTTSEPGDTTTSESGGTTTTGAVPTTAGQNLTLVLKVTEGSCWMVVREDSETGAELYAGTLSAGGQQTFDSAKGYWVRAGIPAALTFTVNGTPFSVTGGAGVFIITETGVERVTTESAETT
jgi:cytoskeleton protein RodZ